MRCCCFLYRPEFAFKIISIGSDRQMESGLALQAGKERTLTGRETANEKDRRSHRRHLE